MKLSNGEYEVHYIGVNWPHHVFVTSDYMVVGAYQQMHPGPAAGRVNRSRLETCIVLGAGILGLLLPR